MHPRERRPFVRPLIELIERVVDRGNDSISASSTPANGNLHRIPEHDSPSLDDGYDNGPR
jgi:hypothetical protein